MYYEIYLQSDKINCLHLFNNLPMIENILFGMANTEAEMEAIYKKACKNAIVLSQEKSPMLYTAYVVQVDTSKRLLGDNNQDYGCISYTIKSHTYGKEATN